MTLTPEDIAAGWVEWRGGDIPLEASEARYVIEPRLDGLLMKRLQAYRLHPAPVADNNKEPEA